MKNKYTLKFRDGTVIERTCENYQVFLQSLYSLGIFNTPIGKWLLQYKEIKLDTSYFYTDNMELLINGWANSFCKLSKEKVNERD